MNRFSVTLKCECVTACIMFCLTGIVVSVWIPTDFGKYVRRVWKLAHLGCNCMQQSVVRLTAEQVFSCEFEVLKVMLQKIQVFWSVTCWLVNSFWPCRGSQCPHFIVKLPQSTMLSLLDSWGLRTVCPLAQCNIPEDMNLSRLQLELIFIFEDTTRWSLYFGFFSCVNYFLGLVVAWWILTADWRILYIVKMYMCIHLNEHLLIHLLFSILYNFVTWSVHCFGVLKCLGTVHEKRNWCRFCFMFMSYNSLCYRAT